MFWPKEEDNVTDEQTSWGDTQAKWHDKHNTADSSPKYAEHIPNYNDSTTFANRYWWHFVKTWTTRV